MAEPAFVSFERSSWYTSCAESVTTTGSYVPERPSGSVNVAAEVYDAPTASIPLWATVPRRTALLASKVPGGARYTLSVQLATFVAVDPAFSTL